MNRSRCPLASAGRLLASAAALTLLLIAGRPALAQTQTRIMFLHHSTGQNLIEQGSVREGLTALGYEFYDHGYNGDGLRLADGEYTGTNFDVPGDNTDPDGLAETFSQPLHDPPDNAFSYLMQYDVIIIKSCFPTSNIADDQQLADDQSYYLTIRDRMSDYPGKLLIIVTQPPQVPANTNLEEGRRARALASWLASDEFLAGHPNVRTFDFFDRLAGNDNFLRPEYRPDDEYDAHPNELANQTIGPEFVAFVDEVIRSYEGLEPGSGPIAAPESGNEVEEESAPEADSPVIAPPSSIVEDFESEMEAWSGFADRDESTVDCVQDGEIFHSGRSALRIDYQIATGGWGGCGRPLEVQDWSAGSGLNLWYRSNAAGKPVTLTVYSGNPDNPGPYQVDFETTESSVEAWAEASFAWPDFVRPDWADASFSANIDPEHITGLELNFVAEETNAGALWVDDIGLTGVEAPEEAQEEIPPEPEEETMPEEAASPAGQACPVGVILPLVAAAVVAGVWRRRGG